MDKLASIRFEIFTFVQKNVILLSYGSGTDLQNSQKWHTWISKSATTSNYHSILFDVLRHPINEIWRDFEWGLFSLFIKYTNLVVPLFSVFFVIKSFICRYWKISASTWNKIAFSRVSFQWLLEKKKPGENFRNLISKCQEMGKIRRMETVTFASHVK